MADVSVVVPVYNVAEYLGECLDSLLRNQDGIDLEVLLVDDGSTDQSSAIAQDYAKRYPNFIYLRKENGGLSSARNYGAARATGEYLIFLDSDDVIPAGTYPNMLKIARRDGSDLVMCRVARCTSEKTWEAGIHSKAARGIPAVTHITRSPQLIWDGCVWNKLIRTSFYRSNSFSFPEGMLYEDMPVALPLHYLANQVSVYNEVGYLWRYREGRGKSITQKRGEEKNYTDRVKSMRMIEEFLEQVDAPRELLDEWHDKTFGDMGTLVDVLLEADDESAPKVMALMQEHLSRYTSAADLARQSVYNRERYAAVLEGNLEAVRRMLSFTKKEKYATVGVEYTDEGCFRKLPANVFPYTDHNAANDLALKAPSVNVSAVSETDQEILVKARMYITFVNTPTPESLGITALLRSTTSADCLPIPVTPEDGTGVTRRYGKLRDSFNDCVTSNNYDGGSFMLHLDRAQLRAFAASNPTCFIELSYRTEFGQGVVALKNSGAALKRTLSRCSFAVPGGAFYLGFDLLERLHFTYQQRSFAVSAASVQGQDLVLECAGGAQSFAGESAGGSVAVCANGTGSCRIALADLPLDQPVRLYAAAQGGRQLVASALERSWVANVGEKLLVCRHCSDGVFELQLRTNAAFLQSIEETKKNRFAFTVNAAGRAEGGQATLQMRDPRNGSWVNLAKTAEGAEKTAPLAFALTIKPESTLYSNLYAGSRRLRVRWEDGAVCCLLADSSIECAYKDPALEVLWSTDQQGCAVAQVSQKWPKEIASARARSIACGKAYKEALAKPLDEKLVLFEANAGADYACNPRAVYEHLQAHWPEYTCVWSLNDPRAPVNGRGRRVRRKSPEYYDVLARAKYLVINGTLEDSLYQKRPGQVVLQTHDGTPLKLTGLDDDSDFKKERDRKTFLERCRWWDFRVVQGSLTEDAAPRMFGCAPVVLKTGQPRTDALLTWKAANTRSVKKRLGIPQEKKGILYAPTWREKKSFDLKLDVDRLRQRFGRDYVLLVRLHRFTVGGCAVPADDEFVFDVGMYSSIENLIGIADVVVTDYSAVAADAVLAGKPTVFYAYDLDSYVEKLRGLYVDFRAEAPGPIAYTMDQLLDVLANLDSAMDEASGRIDAFKQKFLTYECKGSCKKVVKAVFNPSLWNKLKTLWKEI